MIQLKSHYPLLLKALMLLFPATPLNAQTDLMQDTWVGTDALGRKVPTSSEVGLQKTDKNRTVGIFYITWHTMNLHNGKPYKADVTKVLDADPKARLDGSNKQWTAGSYHWGEPEAGYFLSQDEWVIRRDLSMLSDAGVDVLILDVTNAVLYWDEWNKLFQTMHKMQEEGNKVPKFCFWAFNGDVLTVVQRLYEGVYKQNKYRDLWFYWDGKPLMLCNTNPTMDANGGGVKNTNINYDPKAATDVTNPHYGDPDFCKQYYTDYTQEVKDFFTMRNMWWGYYNWAGKRYVGTEDNWSFGFQMDDKQVAELTPEQLAAKHQGRLEEMAVTPAQHPISITGKSWSKKGREPKLNQYDMPVETFVPATGRKEKNPTAWGIYFQDRWNDALKADPDFVYLNDWNEWTAGKYTAGKDPGGKPNKDLVTFLGRKNSFYFVDQYNAEFNRTISPMKGGYTDNYYMQMVDNIRRYKGVRSIPEQKGLAQRTIDGQFDDWKADTTAIYLDTKGDTFHRDFDGYGDLHYTNNSGRNDIIQSKVAFDAENAYFYAETAAPLTPSTDNNWMLLLIDADKNPSTGWYGYDYIVNYRVNDAHTTQLMKWNGKQWKKIANVPYAVNDNKLELSLPRKTMGWIQSKLTFDFKWADNPANLKSPISFCTDGDTAPNRRFNYRCIWSKD